MSKNDQFFDMFSNSFEGYAPEVPTSAYSGLRSKMRMHNFFRFSITSLNVWTILALTTVGGGLWYANNNASFAEAKKIEFSTTTNTLVSRSIVDKTVEISMAEVAVVNNNHDYSKANKLQPKKSNIDHSKNPVAKSPNLPIEETTDMISNKNIVETAKKDGVNTDIKAKNPALTTANNSKDLPTPELDQSIDKNQENNIFSGLINYDKFQTTTNGLKEEINKTNKKEFTIKVKVPK